MLPSPNQLRKKIIIKHKAPNELSQPLTRSHSLLLSASPPPVDEDLLEEDDNYFEFSQNVKVSTEKEPDQYHDERKRERWILTFNN